MSTIKVDGIRHNSASSDAITLASNGTATAKLTTVNDVVMPNGGPLSNRNLIINGAMQVVQRGNQTGITGSNFALDRWNLSLNNGGTWSVSQHTNTPDGFGSSVKLDCTSADSSLGAGDYILFRQKLEGQDCQAFAKGTSSAKQFAVSFYVKTNVNGVYTVELRDNDNSRTCAKTFTVSDNNWNRYTLIFPADTTGALDNDNGDSLQLNFWLGAGSNFTSGTLQTSWGSQTNANRVSSSNANIAHSLSNEFYLTGVQLEVGSVATDFEHRSHGQELALCERYYQTRFEYHHLNSQNGETDRWITFGAPMRASPSITSSPTNSCSFGVHATTSKGFSGDGSGNSHANFNLGWTANAEL